VPRPVVVLGKYFGAAAALLIATLTMIVFLYIGLRHGIMSTARDDIDQPVVFFGFGAVFLAMAVGVWGNFFYGWHFTQTASLLLFPLVVVAWLIILFINKNWQIQNPFRDIKPQIIVASLCIPLAILVLTAVATAASARLGQVMTIVLCFGVFVLGLLSNYLLARKAFINTPVGQIAAATPEKPQMEGFTSFGDVYQITLKSIPTGASAAGGFAPGKPFFYGPNPNGFDMAVPDYQPFAGDVNDTETMFKQGTPPALAVMESNGRRLTVRNVGATPLLVDRPPQPGDFVFTSYTEINVPLAIVWGIVPNMQDFWLTDAVTQNRPVPASHFARIAGYSGAQIVAFLALAIILFQRREVG
ncbi:MAG: hypothetical protein ACT4PL_03450, partial [Phycisphaerales bacterium]